MRIQKQEEASAKLTMWRALCNDQLLQALLADKDGLHSISEASRPLREIMQSHKNQNVTTPIS